MKKWKWALAGAAGGLTAAAAVHRRLLYTEQEQLTAPGTMVEVNGHRMHVYLSLIHIFFRRRHGRGGGCGICSSKGRRNNGFLKF